MADGLNRVFLLGNLGSEPDLKFTQSGTAILTLSVACNESYLDKNRVRQERVEWARCVIFGRRAEALAKFLTKGSKVFVEGSMRSSSYEDREGIKCYKTEIMVKNLIVGGSNNPRSKPRDPASRVSRDDHYDESGSRGGGGHDDDQDYGSGRDDGDDNGIPF